MTLEAAVADYIEQVSGERPEMTPVSSEAVNRLPVYLRRAWDLRRMRLLGRELVLALPRGGPRSGLARLAKDHAALVSGLETEVVVVVPDIRSYERRQLVQKRLPFVAPGRQLFLPMFLADFRETFSPPVQPEAESMSWISQLIVLRHLLIRDVEERPMAEVAEAMGYTAMAVTHGVRQLVALELCTKVPQGRAKTIKFNLEPKALWGRA
ncbi:MAG: hypothetical protein IT368_10740, partial [Candidatus Hydrogenedentes bacterium]|nr:hypothetical protein [Candidatus Hydrogenedentota bacterium]